MRTLTPSQILFCAFMRKLTGSPGGLYSAFHARCWRVHGVLVTLWLRNSTVKVYHFDTPVPDDTAGDRFGVADFPCGSERCREHLSNLYFRHA